MYAGLFEAGEQAQLPLEKGRLGYLHMARGSAMVNGHRLAAGDALLYANESAVIISEGNGAEVLGFDLPA